MKLQGSIELFRYWNELRGNRPAPLRGEISPAALKALLSDIFILGQSPSGAPAFRLAGTRLCASFGRELKDVPLASLWRLRDRALAVELCNQSFIQKTAFSLNFRGISQSGRENPFEMLLLPLASDSPRALGIVSAKERPFWLGTDPIRQARLQSHRAISHAGVQQPLPTAQNTPPLSPLDNDLQPIKMLETTGRRVGHLTVYKGGRDN